jgi:putative membrane protein
MERDPAPRSGVLQVCSRMPERPTMPTETTPDRRTEVAANRTAEAAERTRETAVRTTVAAQRTEASADRRTELAANRTVLAAERTYAAWVRTGLVSLAAGVGAKKTLDGVLPEWVIVLTGSVLVAFAAFCFVAAVWRELFPGTPPPQPDVHRLPRALLFALNGFLALVALAVLFGVWFGRTGGT